MGNRLFGTVMTIGMAMLAMACSIDRAWAEKRIALVIGNSSYESVPKLPNPARDAISIGQMFRDAHFDGIDVIVDATNQELKRALRKFASDVDQADVAVIYFAGHGLEIAGVNYLIPVDAKLASDRDAEDEAVRLDRVISAADGASKLRVIILDACRDNPFPSQMRRNKARYTVSVGLSKTEPTSTDTLIAYAAKAGSTAEDGDGQHSPFTSAILKNLTIPGLDIRLAFGRVKDEVMRVTGSRQEPFVYGSLGGSNFPLLPAPKVQESSEAEIRGDYELVAKIGTVRAWEVFLNTHKTGFYAELARAQVAALTEPQTVGNSVTRSKTGETANGTPVESGTKSGPGNIVVADVPRQSAPGRDSSSQEALEWNKIKNSSDPAAFEDFIRKFPNAPLAIHAQKKLDGLRQAQREREAAQKAAEAARIQADQKKAIEAATKKREEEERHARELEADQKAKAAEAERKAAEERRKAEQAARAAAEAAARAAAERQAKETEEARKKAERDAKEAACRNEQSRLDQIVAKLSAGSGIDDLKSFAATSTCERLSPQISAATDKFKAEQAKREREAAQKAAEEARIEAEKKKAEAIAAKRREDDERRAREAEAAEKARAAAAELAAAKKRDEEKRRAKALEAEQQAKAAEEKRKAEQAEQQRLAAEAAAQRAAAEKQAREEQRRAEQAEAEQRARAAEAERLAAEEKRKAEQALEAEQKAKAAEAERKAAEERRKAEQAARERAAAEAAARRAAEEKAARDAEEARKKVEREAKDTACENEQTKLNQIIANGSAGSGLDDLNVFARTITCERLGAQVVAALDRFKAELAKREREAAQEAADQARIEAEKKKAEAAAAKKREDDERRAKEAEAAEKAKAAAAELAAVKKREEDEQRANAEEAERQAKAAEAQRKAEQEAQERAAAEAAAQQAAREKQAKEDEQRAKQAAAEQQAKAAEAARIAAEEERKADQAAKEAICNSERAELAQIVAKGSEGSGMDDLNAFAKMVTCEKLRPEIVAAVDKFKAEITNRAAAMPNSPQLVQAAQTELVRLGCNVRGKPVGVLNDQTKAALARFLTTKHRSSDDLQVTRVLVAELTFETDRICPLECKPNEVVKENRCVAAPVTSSRRKDKEEDNAAAQRKTQPEKRQAEREQRRAAPEPRARQQAVARPIVGGGGGGGSMIGVGF